ncbi:MAG: RsmE family RNA methyltransferase [Pseudomonadota bacterium]
MSRPRLFVDHEAGAGVLILEGLEHHYLTRVRRLPVGAEVEIVDSDGGAALYRIDRATADRVWLVHEAPLKSSVLAGVLTLLQPLLQRKKLELAVQKATELGVDRIRLVPAERSVARWVQEEQGARLIRLERIVLEASRQSRRDAPPVLDLLNGLAALEPPGEGERRLLLTEDAPESALALADLAGGPRSGRVVVSTGPEGGHTNAEMDALWTAGFEALHLGPLVLRTETASVLACVAGGFALGRYARDNRLTP